VRCFKMIEGRAAGGEKEGGGIRGRVESNTRGPRDGSSRRNKSLTKNRDEEAGGGEGERKEDGGDGREWSGGDEWNRTVDGVEGVS